MRILPGHEKTRPLVADDLGDAADARSGYGQARVSRFNERQRERLAPGRHEEDIERLEVGPCIRHETEEPYPVLHAVVLRVLGEPVFQLAVAHDGERYVRDLGERAYRVLDPFGGMKLSDDPEPCPVAKRERAARLVSREERGGGNAVSDHDEAFQQVREPCKIAPHRLRYADSLVREEGGDGVDGMQQGNLPPRTLLVEGPAMRREDDARHARHSRSEEREASF